MSVRLKDHRAQSQGERAGLSRRGRGFAPFQRVQNRLDLRYLFRPVSTATADLELLGLRSVAATVG